MLDVSIASLIDGTMVRSLRLSIVRWLDGLMVGLWNRKKTNPLPQMRKNQISPRIRYAKPKLAGAGRKSATPIASES